MLVVLIDCSITPLLREIKNILYDKSLQDPSSVISKLTVTLVQLSTAVKFTIGGIPIENSN